MAHRAPFVSGKDSLNNEYLGSDGARHAVPPTLVITAIAHHPNPDLAVTPDLKRAGSVLVLVGDTADEFGGSHFAMVTGDTALGTGPVPAPHADAPARYRSLHTLLRTGRVLACHDLSEGGLGVALAEMCIGGRMGATITDVAHPHVATALFSETTSRFVCELAPADVDWFLDGLAAPSTVLGTVTDEPVLRLADVAVPVEQLRDAFTGSTR